MHGVVVLLGVLSLQVGSLAVGLTVPPTEAPVVHEAAFLDSEGVHQGWISFNKCGGHVVSVFIDGVTVEPDRFPVDTTAQLVPGISTPGLFACAGGPTGIGVLAGAAWNLGKPFALQYVGAAITEPPSIDRAGIGGSHGVYEDYVFEIADAGVTHLGLE